MLSIAIEENFKTLQLIAIAEHDISFDYRNNDNQSESYELINYIKIVNIYFSTTRHLKQTICIIEILNL